MINLSRIPAQRLRKALRRCLKAALIALPLLGLPCAGADLPMPNPLSGEQWADGKDLGLEDWFAPMLPLPDGRVLIFSRDSDDVKLVGLWPSPPAHNTVDMLKNMPIPFGHSENSSEMATARYASVASSAGVWLVGATVELIRPDQPRLTGQLLWPRNNPKAVALDDGSIAVFGSEGWNVKVARSAPERRSVERVSVSADGHLRSEFLPPLPPPCAKQPCDADANTGIWNFAVLHLGGGRIMLTSGYGNPSVYLYEPSRRTWRTVGQLAQARSNFTLTLLPDGRVLATGGNEDYTVGGMTTELWDPKTEQWNPGPLLPVPMREHSAVLWQGKTVVLAGGRFAGVLAWDIGAPSWRVVGQHAVSRARGGVVLLPNDRLAIVGGWHARIYDEGWGRRTPGYSVVDLALGAVRTGLPIGLMQLKKGAFAVHNSRLFAAGGLLTSTFEGSVQDEATALVEVMQGPKHEVKTLPPLPIGTKEAQAAWIDDRRVLTLARGSGDQAPTWFGIIDTENGAQTQLNLPATVAPASWNDNLKLIGISNGQAWLLKNGGQLYGFDLATSAVVEAPRPPSSLIGSSRLLADGRIVATAGAQNYHVFDPLSQRWISSAASLAVGGPTAILRDGRVAKLGELTEEFPNPENRPSPIVRKTAVLEVSNVSASNWRRLALPPPLQGRASIDLCRVLAVMSPGELLAGAVFVGASDGNGQLDWWWTDTDVGNPTWQRVGSAQPPATFLPSVVRLNWGGRRIVLIGGDNGIAAFDERNPLNAIEVGILIQSPTAPVSLEKQNPDAGHERLVPFPSTPVQ